MWVNQGAVPTFKTAVQRLRQKLRPASQRSAAAESAPAHADTAIHPYDAQHGVETSGLIWGEHLASGRRNDTWNTAYYGIAPSVFHAAMRSLQIEHARFIFCDIGSGKGRAVLLAAEYPFREVIGIEIAPELHAIASRNIGSFTPRENLRAPIILLNEDATEFQFPLEPLVLFFYHPFCKPVLQQVLRNLDASLQAHPREVYVVYINPELRGVLDNTAFLERISEATLTMDPEDHLADRVGSTVEECAIYQSRLR